MGLLQVLACPCVSFWVLVLGARYVVLPKDFDKGYKKNVRKADTEHAFYSA